MYTSNRRTPATIVLTSVLVKGYYEQAVTGSHFMGPYSVAELDLSDLQEDEPRQSHRKSNTERPWTALYCGCDALRGLGTTWEAGS